MSDRYTNEWRKNIQYYSPQAYISQYFLVVVSQRSLAAKIDKHLLQQRLLPLSEVFVLRSHSLHPLEIGLLDLGQCALQRACGMMGDSKARVWGISVIPKNRYISSKSVISNELNDI